MKILIAVASTYGSTRDIADWVGDELGDAEHEVTVQAVEDATDLDSYDAVILGTAVYIGRFLTHARQFATRLAQEFAPKPVWVFASGMKDITGNPLQQRYTAPGEPPYLDGQIPIFGGRIDSGELGPAERDLAAFAGSHGGDRRDRDLVRAWAKAVSLRLDQAVAGR